MFLKATFLIFLAFSASLGKLENKQNVSAEYKGNILCLMPIASKSHHIWNRPIMVALANKGYNVTALSVDIDPEPTPGLHYLYMEGVYEAFHDGMKEDPEQFLSNDIQEGIKTFMKYVIILSKATSRSTGFHQLLQYPDDFKFDLVLFDYSGLPDILGFLHKFNYPPLIGVSAFMTPPNTYDITGSVIFPSLIPFYASDFSANMNFWQRSKNLFYYVMDYYYRRKAIKEIDYSAKAIFGKDLPYIGDLEKQMDVVLVNSHPGMDLPEALLPNVIPLGGLQVKVPKPLPEEINKFFESSKKGAVLFSLGTNVQSFMVGEERIQMFVRALAKFPDYHFLWKTDRTDLKVSKNVMTTQWVSQNDVLGHPKMKLFMTHSGLLSTQESTWHGVPMLGIPFFADQFTNVKKSIDAGVAEKLMIKTVTEEQIINVLKRMLEDPSYQKAMDLRSSRFRDRVVPPLQEAVWWCEYVLRHKGAPHLRSAAADMNPLVLFMWDLLIVWGSVFISVIVISKCLLKKIFCSKNCEKNAEFRSKKTN